MKYELHVSDYSAQSGLSIDWEEDFELLIQLNDEGVIIRANKAGLISLAKQLLCLAQDSVPPGHHIHYDSYTSLEDGSIELIIEKIS